jgi:ATP-dependent NAD(P)H-hydrate dehydratase
VNQECSRLAFAKKGRSLQASDLTDEVHTAFLNLFGKDEDEETEQTEELISLR